MLYGARFIPGQEQCEGCLWLHFDPGERDRRELYYDRRRVAQTQEEITAMEVTSSTVRTLFEKYAP